MGLGFRVSVKGLGWVVVKIMVPLWVLYILGYYNRDPKRDHQCGNRPYSLGHISSIVHGKNLPLFVETFPDSNTFNPLRPAPDDENFPEDLNPKQLKS